MKKAEQLSNREQEVARILTQLALSQHRETSNFCSPKTHMHPAPIPPPSQEFYISRQQMMTLVRRGPVAPRPINYNPNCVIHMRPAPIPPPQEFFISRQQMLALVRRGPVAPQPIRYNPNCKIYITGAPQVQRAVGPNM